MEFTEHESTVAVAAVARRGFESLPTLLRRRVGASTWDDLPAMARYRQLSASADLLLPALAALPERPTIGAPPPFTPDEYAAAAESVLRARTDATDPGAWDRLAEKKRRKTVQDGAAVVRAAVEAMPVRRGRDAFVVPDHP